MSMTRATATALLLLLLGVSMAGCGDGGDSGPADTSAGDGDEPPAAGELPKFCELLTAGQVTEAVGAAVTLETAPFDSCEFDQEDPRAASGSLGVVEVGTGNGGFEGYRSGASGSLTNGVDHPIEGLGDEAFVATGTFGGGESLQAGGGVLVGDGLVYTVNLAQSTGMTEDELVAISTRLLELLVDVA
jgi:hypothetical protein